MSIKELFSSALLLVFLSLKLFVDQHEIAVNFLFPSIKDNFKLVN